jgi:hypothetical protein
MRRVAPSVIAREQLQELLGGRAERETNIVSALVETVTRLVVQELVEGEQRDFLGGRGRYDRRGADGLPGIFRTRLLVAFQAAAAPLRGLPSMTVGIMWSPCRISLGVLYPSVEWSLR